MPLPTLLVPGSLISPKRDEAPVEYIVSWIRQRMPDFGHKKAEMADRLLLIQSKTGSGKSTELPVQIFRIFRDKNTPRKIRYTGASVLCTQPRVLTAVDLARRQVPVHHPDMILNETLGYQTGPYSERPMSGLIYATIGVLSAQLQVLEDAEIMDKYKVIIIDEVHERSKEADITLVKLKNFYLRNVGNPKLPFLVLASATMDLNTYMKFFKVGAENVVIVEGRAFPINDNFPEHGSNDYLQDAASIALKIHESKDDEVGKGDILIFVPGNAEAKAVSKILEKPSDKMPPYLVLIINRETIVDDMPEYKYLTDKFDDLPLVNGKKPRRRIIIATSVAETGLTIETLKYVIDCGWCRMVETYQPTALTGLITRPEAQSRALQRKGRAGRVFPGEFYPLFTKNVFNGLEPQQLPDIALNGMDDIILNLSLEQQKQKHLDRKKPEFRIEDIDIIGTIPADAVRASLEKSIVLGFISPEAQLPNGEKGYGITEAGVLASKTTRISQDKMRTILSGYAWKCSTRDLVSLVSVMGHPYETLLRKDFLKKNKGDTFAMTAALRSTLPMFLSQRRTEGGSVESSKNIDEEKIPLSDQELAFYRTRLLIADDFIESFLVLEAFIEQLEKTSGDMGEISEWCEKLGLSISVLFNIIAERESVMEDLLAAKIDPFWGESYRLLTQSSSTFMVQIINLKQCIYDGLQLNLLRYDKERNVYENRFGMEVAVPPIFSDKELMNIKKLGIEQFEKPRYIVTDQVVLKPVKSKKTPEPLLYSLKTRMISVMTGYVDIDPEKIMAQSEEIFPSTE